MGTVACTHWKKKKKCPHGRKCGFRHGENDDRFNERVGDPRFRELGGGLCRFFARGFCTSGKLCEDSHAHVATVGYPEAEDLSEVSGSSEAPAENTTPCSEWLRSGKCANGDRCAHLHREIDPRINSLVKLPRFRHLLPKGVMCRDFGKGYCARGADCNFGHAHVATRGYPRAEDPSKWPKKGPILGPRDPGYGESQCPDWVWNDVCPRGDQCEHSHYHTNESIAARIAASSEPRSSVASGRSLSLIHI